MLPLPLSSSTVRVCRPDYNILHISLWLLTSFFSFPLIYTHRSCRFQAKPFYSRQRPSKYHFSLFPPKPFFLLPSVREIAPRKDSPGRPIRSERVGHQPEGDQFCFPELFTGCLTTCISIFSPLTPTDSFSSFAVSLLSLLGSLFCWHWHCQLLAAA